MRQKQLTRAWVSQVGMGITLLLVVWLSGCGAATGQPIARVTPLAAAPTQAPTAAPTLPPAPVTQAPETSGTATPRAESTRVAAAPAQAAETPPQSSPKGEGSAPTATPTPFSSPMPAGSARAIAEATDVAMRPEIATPLTFDEQPVTLRFDEFYAGFDIRRGVVLSDKLKSLDGLEVVMEGYMAPPLKPELDWFVLTRIRLEYCPFCSSGADWPMDIAVVYLSDSSMVATQAPVRISGRIEIGNAIDPETGMVSLVRIYAEKVEVLQS